MTLVNVARNLVQNIADVVSILLVLNQVRAASSKTMPGPRKISLNMCTCRSLLSVVQALKAVTLLRALSQLFGSSFDYPWKVGGFLSSGRAIEASCIGLVMLLLSMS